MATSFCRRNPYLHHQSWVLLLGLLYLSTANTQDAQNDIQNFLNINSSTLCTQDSPTGLSFSDTTSSEAVINWKRLSNETDITGYQVLYWPAASTVFQLVNTSLTNTTSLTGLIGGRSYNTAVRAVCKGGDTGPATRNNNTFSTPPRAPAGAPVLENPMLVNRIATIVWSELPNDLWNGHQLRYEVDVTNITPDVLPRSAFYNVSANKTALTIDQLNMDHRYLVVVRAVSSGGVGPESDFIIFPLDDSTTVPTGMPVDSLSTYGFFLIIPAVLVLAIVITIGVFCIKKFYEHSTGKISYVTDISKNIEQGRMMTMSQFNSNSRLEALRRSSQHGRPLPAQPLSPHGRDPLSSANSLATAHLLKEQQVMGPYPSESAFTPPRKMPHPGGHPKLDSDPGRGRTGSVQSPGLPQLSQPFSDISSNTNSSVFMEPAEKPAAALSPPNPYEVPADSETGHHSTSPPSHTLPHPRRPQTAHGRMMTSPSNPQIPPPPNRAPPPLTQSSLELFHHGLPPIVPPHHAHSTLGSLHSPVEIIRESPQAGNSPDYSEVPMDSEIEGSGVASSAMFSSVAPGSTTGHSTLHPDSSIVSSDQYSSYSEAPCDVMPPIFDVSPPPFNAHHQNPDLSSESISSFSTDSQAGGSPPGSSRHWGEIAPEGRASASVFSGHSRPSRETTPIGRFSSDIPKTHNIHESPHHPVIPDATPYLSPTSLVPSNGRSNSVGGRPSQ